MITDFRRRRRIAFARERDELNNGSGCGPWLILIVGYIVTLTAIGISLIVISAELAR
jgi:hypothetical protein